MPEDLVRVGRWMSRQEYTLMMAAAQVQESRSGTTHVAFPADQTAFQAQAAPGSFYIEFDVPRGSIKPTRQGWAKIIGPNTLEARLALRMGEPEPQMPPASNIQHCTTK
jgi:hypothetical protein